MDTSRYNIANYRPISHIEIHSKLVDKILNADLSLNLERTQTTIRQHGFGEHKELAHSWNKTFYETLEHTQGLEQ